MKFQSYDATLDNIDPLHEELNSGNHVFILIYMDGCGPCNVTKPSWYALKPTLQDQYNQRDDIAIIDVERKHLPNIKDIGEVDGFPTIKYIHKKRGHREDYNGSRSKDDFIKWIESKIQHVESMQNENMNKNKENITISEIESALLLPKKHKRKSKGRSKAKSTKKKLQKTNKFITIQEGGMKKTNKTKKLTKRRWSQKYKKSINCKKPKGFSQKQYCKYGRK